MIVFILCCLSLFLLTHLCRKFCWLDKWYGLTLDDVRKIELDLAQLLVKKIQEGEISNCALIAGD